MTDPNLTAALSLTADSEALTAQVAAGFSNGPQGMAPEVGAPFGGLMAALAARSMREGLEIKPPLRTLSVQFAAAARFEQDVAFRPRKLRGGRRVAYTAVEADQGGRLILHATATWGVDAPAVDQSPLFAVPPARDSLGPILTHDNPMSPWFTRHIEQIHDGGPNILGGNIGKPAVERVWMRVRVGECLDTDRLCFLLDALYPPAWTLFTEPVPMTSVDLRYDILTDPTPELCPDGWAFFEYAMLDLGLGWTIDDCVCWAPNGTPLALARQRRKLL